MKSIRKIITAAAAAAVIATVGATTAFAALPPANGVNKIAFGKYINMDYGTGYTKTFNSSSTTRYCSAYVETQTRITEIPISGGSAYNMGKEISTLSAT